MLSIPEINKWVRQIEKYSSGGVAANTKSDRLTFTCKNDEVKFELEIFEASQRLVMYPLITPFDPRTAFWDLSVIDITDYEHLLKVLNNYSRISYHSDEHCHAQS